MTDPKYKQGDYVEIINYQRGCEGPMSSMIGTVLEVKSVTTGESNWYRLKGDGYGFGWREDWLAPAGIEYSDILDNELNKIYTE